MLYVDTNILLRYLLYDNETLAQTAKTLIEENDCLVKNEVFCEVVYVLSKVYLLPRKDIATACNLLLEKISVENELVMQKALATYAETSLDFVDCLLYAYNKVLSIEVHTFDKKLQNKLNSSDS